jgi:hypothetical protein
MEKSKYDQLSELVKPWKQEYEKAVNGIIAIYDDLQSNDEYREVPTESGNYLFVLRKTGDNDEFPNLFFHSPHISEHLFIQLYRDPNLRLVHPVVIHESLLDPTDTSKFNREQFWSYKHYCQTRCEYPNQLIGAFRLLKNINKFIDIFQTIQA